MFNFVFNIAFVFTTVFLAKLVWGISLSNSVDFVFKVVSAAKLMILDILFSISVGFILRAAAVTNSVTLGILI